MHPVNLNRVVLMKVKLRMKWIEARNEWHLLMPSGAFVYNLFNCKNVQKLFDKPDQGKEETFIVDIHRVGENGG